MKFSASLYIVLYLFSTFVAAKPSSPPSRKSSTSSTSSSSSGGSNNLPKSPSSPLPESNSRQLTPSTPQISQLRIDTKLKSPHQQSASQPSTPKIPVKPPQVDSRKISEIRKNPGDPPKIVDTTSKEYNNNWPKPDESPKKANDPIKTPKTSPTTPDPLSRSPLTPVKDKNKPQQNTGSRSAAPGAQKARPDKENQPPQTPRNRNQKSADSKPPSLTPGQKKIEIEKQKASDAEDAAEVERKKNIQKLLDSGKHHPERPDSDWTPPSPTRTGKGRGKSTPGKPTYHPRPDPLALRTPYHPNAQSSGRIKAPPREHQYSGRPGSPRNDPGFRAYTNDHDPYDRSYVRADRYKDKNGVKKVAATGVYDARNMPYHAANKLNNLKKEPQMTYGEAVKSKEEAEENRKVTKKVMRTTDPNRLNWKGKPLANVKEEAPHAGTHVWDTQGQRLTAAARIDRSNVVQAPDRESRGEGLLRTSTLAEGKRLAAEQNAKNLAAGKPTQRVMLGTAVMDGQTLQYDHGNDKIGPYNMPSPDSPVQASPSAPIPPAEAGPSQARQRIPTRQDLASEETARRLQAVYNEEHPPLSPLSPISSSSSHLSQPPEVRPERSKSPELSKAEGKKPQRNKKRDLEDEFRIVLRRWTERQYILAEREALIGKMRMERRILTRSLLNAEGWQILPISTII